MPLRPKPATQPPLPNDCPLYSLTALSRELEAVLDSMEQVARRLKQHHLAGR